MLIVNAELLVAATTLALMKDEPLIVLPPILFVLAIFYIFFGAFFAVSTIAFLSSMFYLVTYSKWYFLNAGVIFMDFYLIDINIIELFFMDWRVANIIIVIFIIFFIEIVFLIRVVNFRFHNLKLGLVLFFASAVLMPFSLSTLAKAGETGDAHNVPWILGFKPSIANFVASIYYQGLWVKTEPRADWADKIQRKRDFSKGHGPSMASRKINLFVILYESTFDPLHIGGESGRRLTSEILRPKKGLSGPLFVPVYGGGTWATEFALMTGQTPLAFGANAYNLNSVLEGKLRGGVTDGWVHAGHALNVIYPFSGNFVNAQSFYQGLGVNFSGPPNVKRPDQVANAVRKDHALFDRARRSLDPARSNFQLIVTMLNHGPHSVMDPFRDYVGRLRQQEKDLSAFKNIVENAYGDRENYFVAFGDHQPYFTRRYALGKEKKHTTFWSLDCVGRCDRMRGVTMPKTAFGVEFLLNLLFQQLDLLTGPIFPAHRELISRGCTSLDFHCAPRDVNAFNWFFGQVVLKQ